MSEKKAEKINSQDALAEWGAILSGPIVQAISVLFAPVQPDFWIGWALYTFVLLLFEWIRIRYVHRNLKWYWANLLDNAPAFINLFFGLFFCGRGSIQMLLCILPILAWGAVIFRKNLLRKKTGAAA